MPLVWDRFVGKSFGVTFADQFELSDEWMRDHGVFNPTLDIDSPLFIDPFLLPGSKHHEFSDCAFDRYEAHFAEILRLLLNSEEIGDKAWQGALRRFQFSEARGMGGTCLGYSSSATNNGRSFGPGKSARALRWAQAVVKLGVKDPEMFSTMPLFEDGIGPDLISDMVTHITLPCILDFNSRILEAADEERGADIPRSEFRLRGKPAILAENPLTPGAPIILLADDILKYLPLFDDPRGAASVAEHNQELRDRVNDHIGEIFKVRFKHERESIAKRALTDAPSFQTFLDLLKQVEKHPYNVYKDPQGFLQWSSAAADFTAAHKFEIKDDRKLPRLDRIDSVCVQVIQRFTEAVENERLWRVFYVDQEPRPERFAQLLFYAIAKSYCAANDLDISPESDGGAGPVDFKFSNGTDKVVVEIKLSTNPNVVKGFTKQLQAYMAAEQTNRGHYVVIDVGQLGAKWDRLQDTVSKERGFRALKTIHLVDGTIRSSASKLR